MSKNQTINDALKALFLELGGDATKLADNSKISDYIDDLASVIEPKDPEYFDITLTQAESAGTGTIDKTLAEINAAIAAGKVIRIVVADTVYFGGSYHIDDSDVLCVTPNYFGYDSNNALASIGFIFYSYGNSDSFYTFAGEIELGSEASSVYTVAKADGSI